MTITTTSKGDFKNTLNFLNASRQLSNKINFDMYGQRGVDALSSATPIDSGLTESSWYYKVVRGAKYTSLNFYNSNVQDGVPIAIIVQYGHATKNGGWVEGRDYINPAVQPIFDEIASSLWTEVKSL